MTQIKNSLIVFLLLLPILSVFSQKRSDKRGVSYQIPFVEDVVSLSAGSSWFYNWGTSPIAAVDEVLGECDMDFLPMAWNGNFDEKAIRNYLTTHPNVKYLLGFNEPNFKAQANMLPAVAAAKWKILEKIADDFDLKLVSPAVNFSPDAPYQDPVKYLDDFFSECPDCRVDYVAVHCYMSYPSALMWYINKFKKYGKPIWLTEFCAWDNFWEVPGDAANNQLNFMVDALNYLENDPDVFRYAWFIPRTGEKDKWPFMQLLEDGKPGSLTALGQVFVNMSAQDKSFFFDVDSRIPAEHYSSTNIADIPNSDNWKSSISLQPTTDDWGILNIKDFKDNRWVEYAVNVSSEDNYQLLLRVSAKADAVCKVFIDGKFVSDFAVRSTGGFNVWDTQKAPLTISAGNHSIRLLVSSGDINLNWLGISSRDDIDGLSTTRNGSVTLYPNPVTDKLMIHSETTPVEVAVFNLSGQPVLDWKESRIIEMDGLAGGVYYVRMQFADGTVKTLPVIKR